MGPLTAFRENAATFYGPVTKASQGVARHYAFVAGAAIVALALNIKVDSNFFENLISVLGVLLGFGFSIQFYVAGSDSLKISEGDFLEDEGDKRTVNLLGNELYSNILYLNYIVLFALISAFACSLPMIPFLALISGRSDFVFSGLAFLIFWFLCFEVVATFFRCLMRSSLFFSERRRLLNETK